MALRGGFRFGRGGGMALRGGIRLGRGDGVTLRSGFSVRGCRARGFLGLTRRVPGGVGGVDELIDAGVERIDLIVQVHA
ncbi:hypothetical protein [Burkholderia sp. lig30]|uniref:hypothetical protein n=1 Tax=Burkholderia sp. lig30 TaxID=1192124 RepID=UPI001F1F041C|nr:hypothetical protein [Burkholderia sp. lig30]